MRVASSTVPVSWDAPPLKTTRARGSAAKGESASRSRTISKISSARCRTMFAIVARDTICGASCSSPAVGTDISSRASDPPVSTVPYKVLIRSASAMHAPTPRARSIVTCCPPSANPDGMNEAAGRIGRNRGRAGAHFDHGGAEIGLVVGQHRQACDIRTCRHGLDIEMAALDHQHQVAGHRGIRRDDVHVDAELAGHHAAGIADALDAIERVADRQRVQHGAALAGGVAHAGGGDAGDVIGGNRAAADVGGGLDQLALQPAAGNRQQYRLRRGPWPCARPAPPPGAPPARIRRDRPPRRP